MAETVSNNERVRQVRHHGRGRQIIIYLGKQLRFFINENGWKVLPMAAIIAALVGMVIRKKFFITMEGSLIGGFAVTFMCIWNGSFNSIQAVCRERAIIKREHRSGMHISSYVAAHMIYQFLLCLAQTLLSAYVLLMVGVQIPDKGFLTSSMLYDLIISMFLVTYASDMMSLFISSVSRTTTGAMTVMPFVLIFQLIFSGGILPLPQWSKPLSNYTISNYGIKAITAQSGYNELPMTTAWNTLESMRSNEIGGTITLGQVMDILKNPSLEKYRDTVIIKSYTVGEAADMLNDADKSLHLRDKEIVHPIELGEVFSTLQTNPAFESFRERVLFDAIPGIQPITVGSLLERMLASEELKPVMERSVGTTITLGQVLDFLYSDELAKQSGGETLIKPVTLGKLIDLVKDNPALEEYSDKEFTFKTTIGDIFEVFGEDNVKKVVQEKTAAASQKAEYTRSFANIGKNWMMLIAFTAVFAVLSTLVLELIDKDKR